MVGVKVSITSDWINTSVTWKTKEPALQVHDQRFKYTSITIYGLWKKVLLVEIARPVMKR